jgi:flagellar hook-associated protein 3 FlgL
MKRISTNMPSDDMQYHMRLREWNLNELSNKMATQSRINNLRDDPLAAMRSVRYQSELARMMRYSENVETAKGNLAVAEGYVKESTDILQRVREIAVQGANGVYDKDQLSYMGEEVDQLLHEVLLIANSKNADGTSLFGGFRTEREPFRANLARVFGSERIESVEYLGNVGKNKAEISEGAFTTMSLTGNYVFWAENQNIFSQTDATNYQVQADTQIKIDGVDIQLATGDNIYAIMSKINDSSAPVKASLDPVRNSLVLETTTPHQMWVRDGENGKVLQDLGIIQAGDATPPLNIASGASKFGGSVFDVLIRLRDNLFQGNQEAIGGAGLGGIDNAIKNMVSNVAEIGAKDNRLDMTAKRLNDEIPEVTDMNSKEVDLDLTQAITDMKMLEYTQKAALDVTARIIRPTLLDYLR